MSTACFADRFWMVYKTVNYHRGGPQIVAQISRPYHNLGPRPIHLTGSILAEPTVELPVVPTIDVAIAVEIEISQVAGLASVRLERGSEEVAILPIHIVVAVCVAE